MNPDNNTVVLLIKGTTLNGLTSKADKLNDNLMSSCCCARVDIAWVFRTVCDCYVKHWQCDNTCLSKLLVRDSLFYNIGLIRASSFTCVDSTAAAQDMDKVLLDTDVLPRPSYVPTAEGTNKDEDPAKKVDVLYVFKDGGS